jgi:hypothetical protein
LKKELELIEKFEQNGKVKRRRANGKQIRRS